MINPLEIATSLTPDKSIDSENPIRSEIYTSERLMKLAKLLAHSYKIKKSGIVSLTLKNRLEENKSVLEEIHKSFVQALNDEENKALPSSVEWLLDNFYVVSEQILQTRQNLTTEFYKELPIVKNGDYKGYPRIYGLSMELIKHTDSRIDKQILEEFVNAYQAVSPLSSAEIWAAPIMLRLGLFENLRRLMEQSAGVFRQWQQAEKLAEKINKNKDEKQIDKQIKKAIRSEYDPDPVYLIHLIQSIKETGQNTSQLIHKLEEILAEKDINIEEFIRTQNSYQVVNRITTGNVITSLRSLAAIDWSSFYEDVSLVEKILRTDPVKVYETMDKVSRDRYRHVIEDISKQSELSEQEVARRAINLSEKSESLLRTRHVGYYLLDEGLKKLKEEAKFAPTVEDKVVDLLKEKPLRGYLLISGIMLFVLTAATLTEIPGFSFWEVLLLLIPMSVPAIGLSNWFLTLFLDTNAPVKIDLDKGIPDKYKTIVAIPCFLNSTEDINTSIAHLESRFLANRDDNLYFCLLADLPDSKNNKTPMDKELKEAAIENIKRLNETYGEKETRFFLFLRKRIYNPKENLWMGWERKRGKLIEFNKLLRGSKETSFETIIGNQEVLKQIKYVITLDADTELPMNTARRLIGAMIHPLNKPIMDKNKKRIIKGYGIIQPRVDVTAPTAISTKFAQILTEDSGLDPYSSAASDVYQDLFGSGAYIGKAIYDVDAVLTTLEGRFPENFLLSHDLIEGEFARTGLASDIQLLENFPTGWDAYTQRQHRWIRGDWQIIDWIMPVVPNGQNKLVKNDLPALGKWKIFDNIRRSLVAPMTVLLLVLSWTVLPGSPIFWTIVAMAAYLYPLLQRLITDVFVHPKGESNQAFLAAVGEELLQIFQQALLWTILLLPSALRNVDAIIMVIYRKYFSKKNLLEWTTHETVEKRQAKSLKTYYQRMRNSVLLSVLLLLTSQLIPLKGEVEVIIFSILWMLSPLTAYLTSQKIVRKINDVSANEKEILYGDAFRIWRFFEEFTSEEDHYLPPDNYQENPKGEIAHKTSPTNIGLYLLSTISAYDMGFIGINTTLERIEKTFMTIESLDKFNGHLYNWYNTHSLEPLNPVYVSTVDSGNFIGSLVALRQSLRDIRNKKRDKRKTLRALGVVFENLEKVTGKLRRKNLDKTKIRKINLIINKWKNGNNDEKTLKTINYWQKKMNELGDEYFGNEKNSEKETRIKILLGIIKEIIEKTDFGFLFNQERMVFSIGYNVRENRLDDSYYDLLASEARLTSFLAIAMQQAPRDHWFKLSRPLRRMKGKMTLLSWGGSMFEYLMPNLLMEEVENTLITQSNFGIIDNQIDYGNEKQIPWGFSESGFYTFDFQYNYQYRLFGLPALGLKSDLKTSTVVASYASFLALPYEPEKASNNLLRIKKLGGAGDYGFYEAIDFTPENLPANQDKSIVQSYMAHHQGMSMLSLNNYLNKNILRQRFNRDPIVASCKLLLQERIPKHALSLEVAKEEKKLLRNMTIGGERVATNPFTTAHTAWPRINILSNGTYLTAISNTGSGYSLLDKIELTGWHHDPVLDNSGYFIYIKDLESQKIWSGGYQPTLEEADKYEVSFLSNKAQFTRKDGEIITRMEVLISPEKNAEIRQLILTNTSDKEKKLEITSYAEVSLDEHRGRIMHPAFSKLFIESEFDENYQSLLFRRKPKKETDKSIWLFHKIISENPKIKVEEYETSRIEFLGRGGKISKPKAMENKLSNTEGVTLDPIMSLRSKIVIKPGTNVRIAFITGAAESRQECEEIISSFSDIREINRTIDFGQVQSQIELQHLNISEEEAGLFQRLASRIIYPDPILKAQREVVKQVSKGQSALYPYGISGDLPIVLLKTQSKDDLPIIRQMLLAHEYLRLKNFHFDLVIMIEKASDYFQDLEESIRTNVESSLSGPWIDKKGGIFIRKKDQMEQESLTVLTAAARVIIDCNFGNLADHISLSIRIGHGKQQYVRKRVIKQKSKKNFKPRNITKKENDYEKELYAFNGWGGFDRYRSEYVIRLSEGIVTPMPWSNVLANEKFGSVLTESGVGYTFGINSQTEKITPWTNDAVADHSGEIIYLHDVKNQETWTVTSLPIRESEDYKIRHGKGYSIYEHTSHGIEQRLAVLVTPKDPVKIYRLRLNNLDEDEKELKIYFYVEWVLGANREVSKQYIDAEYDENLNIIYARNGYQETGNKKFAFLATNIKNGFGYTDRRMFLGRNGSYDNPRGIITNSDGTGKIPQLEDSAGILGGEIKLKPGEEKEVLFILGENESEDNAEKLRQRYLNFNNTAKAFKEIKKYWTKTLETFEISTPNKNMDLLFNQWLPYQVLSGRFWARAGFYQASGAFGFRDQLQDVMALIYSHPEITKDHILTAAKHQFIEGDVQHWWHPPTNAGVRTRISDDFLWLPYVTAFYIEKTGDWSILREKASYIEMPKLEEGQEDLFGTPTVSDITENIYDHCVRAVEHGFRFGVHGLPLIGSGDWNDGLNNVGIEGKGESVWLGWFLFQILEKFILITDKLGDKIKSQKYKKIKEELQAQLDSQAWDGEWFLRGYFDDGTPLGSASASEGEIDSIAQSWSVISGGGGKEKASLAMKSAYKYLVDKESQLIKLLTPPFSNLSPSPGYIQAYPKGIRENGGQYTHGVIWMIMAEAELGEGDKAMELFDILNPINHGDDKDKIDRFKVEPYVMPADVYTNPQHTGRGGWSWYTGSAGWMYRSAIENILGFKMNDNGFTIEPCIPKDWEDYQITYRSKGAEYRIEVINKSKTGKGKAQLWIDGLETEKIPQLSDGKIHEVKAII